MRKAKKQRKHGPKRAALLAGSFAIIFATAFACFLKTGDHPPKQPTTLHELLAMPSDQREKCDIARVNLLCAEGLAGAEKLDVANDLGALDKWASEMYPYIESCVGDFRKNPAAFKNNEGICRMAALITFVQRKNHVDYNPGRNPYGESSQEFFKNSKDLFIHGLIEDPHLGTCASMPVLYTALGRRLGYPLRLVTTKNHLFVRWESPDGKNSFNIEGTNRGMSSHDYDHYKKWPSEMSESDLQSGEYLHPLSPSEELALFLSTRGICLQVNGRLAEAKKVYAQGASIAPSMKSCARLSNQKILN